MVTTKMDYPELAVKAAETVMLELMRILGEYRDNIVIIGGMVPRYLIPEADEPHIGTTDVDLALDHRHLSEEGYRTIHELLTGHDYVQDTDQPFIYRRQISIDDNKITVQVDLLSGEYGGTGKSRRTQKVQDVRPRKARGADLVFDHPENIEITGILPGGGKDKAIVKISGIIPFIIMKAMAMRDRLKEKDPYDIYYCLQYYPGGPQKIAELLAPVINNKLVQEALAILAEKFESPKHVGPVHIAEFMEIDDSDDKERVQRDAYERVRSILDN
ncbi:MAG: hypothetical protein ACE5HI_12065 [bacterium]